MNPWKRVPVHFRGELITYLFVALAFGAGYAADLGVRAQTYVQHSVRVVHADDPAKAPQKFAGTALNAQLTGFRCGFWRSKHLIVCK